jgi:hypothetical protein
MSKSSPTEAVKTDCFDERAILMSIAYLKRNDFKKICHMGLRLISARDGSRLVLVWLDFSDAESCPLVVPEHLVQMAEKMKARVDVMRIRVVHPDKAFLKHTMNVLSEA